MFLFCFVYALNHLGLPTAPVSHEAYLDTVVLIMRARKIDNGTERVSARGHAVALRIPGARPASTAVVGADQRQTVAGIRQARSDALARSLRHGGRLHVKNERRGLVGIHTKKSLDDDNCKRFCFCLMTYLTACVLLVFAAKKVGDLGSDGLALATVVAYGRIVGTVGSRRRIDHGNVVVNLRARGALGGGGRGRALVAALRAQKFDRMAELDGLDALDQFLVRADGAPLLVIQKRAAELTVLQ